MKLSFAKYALFLAIIYLSACGPYKQLKPKPEIIPRETVYIEILDKDKNFELKSGKKYFLEFPGIPENSFYLVLKVNQLEALSTYFTPQFNKGKGQETRIPDESSPNDDLLVYKLTPGVPTFYWVIAQVRRETLLDVGYRYLPIWRYRFESKQAEFQLLLARNKLDRPKYESLGSGGGSNLNYEAELADTRQKIANLQKLQQELRDIESIFPPYIKNSADKAYLDYVGLKGEVEKELQLLHQYQTVLTIFAKSRGSRYSNESFVEAMPNFREFFEKESQYPETIRREVENVLEQRLSEVVPFYENQLRRKRDTSPIDFPAGQVGELYRRSGRRMDSQLAGFLNFVETYNRDVRALQKAKEMFGDIQAGLETEGSWPSNRLYPSLQSQLGRLQTSLPAFSSREYGRYVSYSAVENLEREVRSLNSRVDQLQRDFQTAAGLVPQINRLRDMGDYRAIISLLKNNRDLDFLLAQYPDLDERYLNQQAQEFESAIQSRQWALAEQKLRELSETSDFLDYRRFESRKLALSKSYEEQLVTAIEEASRRRINEFIEANKGAINTVESLYNSPAFQPVYTLTFSAGGPGVVARYNQKVQNYLDSFKYDQFPKMSIETIYRDFSRNIQDNGVAKARAIITHGRYYRGKDQQIKNLIAEVDPQVAKWITKPKTYRKVFVIPSNQTQQSSNQYLFRLNIRIPSDAQFPVWDVNIKLPREVANVAGQQQWYQQITMNDKLLKNEGRFTISAPTPANDYECQITPVQMNKDQDNILEVRFNHDAFKVLEVSVMCQRPIIKRD